MRRGFASRRALIAVPLLGWALVLVPATPGAQPAATAPATTSASTTLPATSRATIELPSFGVAVAIPPGYARIADTEKSVFMVAPAELVGQPPQRVLTLNFKPRGGTSFDAAVREIGEGMRVTRADASLGGLKATELVGTGAINPGAAKTPTGGAAFGGGWGADFGTPSGTAAAAGSATADKQPLRSLRALLVEREGYYFCLSLIGTAENADDGRAFDFIAQHLRWRPIERATAAISVREPLVSLGGGLSVCIPDPFRPEPSSQKGVAVSAARDLPTRVPVARLFIQRGTADPNVRTLADLKVHVDRKFGPAWKLKQPLRWRDRLDPMPLTVSQPAATPTGWMQAMLVFAPDGRSLVFSMHARGSIEDAGSMRNVFDVLRTTIRVAPPPPPPRGEPPDR